MPSDHFRTGIISSGYFNYFLSKSVICICIAWELKCPLWTRGFSVTAQAVARERRSIVVGVTGFKLTISMCSLIR